MTATLLPPNEYRAYLDTLPDEYVCECGYAHPNKTVNVTLEERSGYLSSDYGVRTMIRHADCPVPLNKDEAVISKNRRYKVIRKTIS